MHIFNSKSPPKARACADSRRNFWTTNLKTPVCQVQGSEDPGGVGGGGGGGGGVGGYY